VVTIDRRLGRLLPYRVAFFPTAEYARHAVGELEPRGMARLIAADVNVAVASCVIRSGINATTCIDLNRPLEELRGRAHSGTRNKLGKAEKLLGRIEIVRNGPTAKHEFVALYQSLVNAKGSQVLPLNAGILDRYTDCSDIFIAYLDGTAICGHVNLRDDDISRSRLLYSASKRFDDAETARLSGILNCYLHWHEIVAYKDAGFDTYDFGGLSNGQRSSAEGIDRFKLGFGGDVVEEHTYLCAGIPSLGRLILRLFDTGRNR
jgi:lipid II:glycine glycyltransferase (peptidoglycan interpeptide bridge formation enzyme)